MTLFHLHLRNRSAPQCLLQCNLCIVDGPEDGIISQYTFCFGCRRSSRIAEYSRRIVVIPCFSSKITARVTKSCTNSASFDNTARRETFLRLLNSTELFCVRNAVDLSTHDRTNLTFRAWCLEKHLPHDVFQDTMSGRLCEHDGLSCSKILAASR